MLYILIFCVVFYFLAVPRAYANLNLGLCVCICD